MKIFRIFNYLFLILFSFKAYGSELDLSLDKDVMSESDTLYLTLSYTGSSKSSPDLSALQKDFQIVSNSVSQQVSIINGSVSQNKIWTIGVVPLQTGKITIKPISIDNISSNYAEIEVKPLTNEAFIPDSKENLNAPYFKLEQSIDNSTPYVQQQVNIIVTLYDSLGLHNGSFSIDNDTKNDWQIVQLTDTPKTTQKVINGRRMNVSKILFAAFPQKSGILKTPQFIFDGYYIKNVDFDFPHFDDSFKMFGVNFNNAFGQRVPVKMRTNVEKTHVLPIPNDFTPQTWLPLTDLKIQSEWNHKKSFNVGDAISRKIVITTTGLPQSSLPSFKFPDIKDFKQYPEKPTIKEEIVDGQIRNVIEINTVYIPTNSGTYTFPPLEIKWFNTKTRNTETTILPKEKIEIASSSSMEKNTYWDNNSEENNTENTTIDDTQTNTIEESKETPKPSINYTFYQIIILLGVILFFIIFVFILFKRKAQFSQKVISAIKQRNYPLAKKHLLSWAQEKYDDINITNFNMIADLAENEEFSEQLSIINRLLYSDSDEIFDHKQFIKIFKKINKQRKVIHKKSSILPNLYD